MEAAISLCSTEATEVSTGLFVGLMSGTSLDGVDAALVRFDRNALECVATRFLPFPSKVRNEALALQRPGSGELRRSALLANTLADLYAEATLSLLDSAKVSAQDVKAIGCHGQTLLHSPSDGYSLQLNNPSRLVEKTGITVVADFRNRDIAAGGQGAPLVPAFHDAIFRHPSAHRIVLNIGGIANITSLKPAAEAFGFDTGPGNMLLDAWISRHTGAAFDANGSWAAKGRARPDLLATMRHHPYFSARPPKSCGREQFDLGWLETLLNGSNLSPTDVQATLLMFTATTIVDAVKQCEDVEELYVCGGGSHNATLMRAIREGLVGVSIESTDALGLPADWVEAVAFAWLAWRHLRGQAGNLPRVTGATGPRILGALYPV